MTVAPNSLAARDIAYVLHPYTNLAAHEERGPLIITRGEGIHVWDDDGRKYIEGLAGLWCTSLGFSEKRLADAAYRQLQTLPYSHIFNHQSTIPVVELAERLLAIAPEPMAKAFFVNSGSEAVDSAIKMVWYYNNALDRREKKKIIGRRRGYHGVTIASASLTALPMVQNDFDLPIDRILQTDLPHHYREGEPGESEEAFASRLAASLEQLILDEGPDTVAAFIAEPVMGAGGVIPPPATYFAKVQEVLRRHDVLMIADEVICGFGRTGSMWGSVTYGIRPDMMTFAKQLTSGYIPAAGVMVSDQVFRTIADHSARLGGFGTGYTYGGHPVAAAVGVETLKIYEETDIVSRVRDVAPHFQDRLAALGSHPLVGETRGVGLLGGIEFVEDKASKQPFPAPGVGIKVATSALEHGLIVRRLPDGDTIGICPPLIITRPEIDDLFDRLERAMEDATRGLKSAA